MIGWKIVCVHVLTRRKLPFETAHDIWHVDHGDAGRYDDAVGQGVAGDAHFAVLWHGGVQAQCFLDTGLPVRRECKSIDGGEPIILKGNV